MNTNLVFSLVVLAGAAASAQELVWRDVGLVGAHSYGGFISALGDMDRDGYEDLLCIGRDMADPSNRVRIMVVSGRAGGLLRRRPVDVRNPWSMTGVGDMDGDGIPDYAVNWANFSGNNLVEVCSSVDDRVLWSVNGLGPQAFGMSLLGGVDLNGDRRPDLVLTWPRDANDGLGSVVAYDHRGTFLWKRRGTNQLLFNYEWYETLSRIGDVDRDGAEDVIVGATDLSGPGTGAAVVLSGRDGRTLTIGRDPQGYQIGYANAGAGDVDGDGTPDIASVSDANVAAVYSGRTGALIWRWGPWPGHVFHSVAAGLDLDRDGVPDVVLGAPGLQLSLNHDGRIYAFSGRDGTELFHIDNTVQPTPRIGDRLAVLRRANEVFPTFVEQAPEYFPYTHQSRFGYLGWLRAFRGTLPGAEIYAAGCAGSAPSAPRIGVRRFGDPDSDRAGARIHLSNSRPSRQAVLAVGFSRQSWLGNQLPIALDRFGFPGCALATSVEILATATTRVQGPGSGYAFVDLPRLASIPAIELYAQWIVLDPEPNRLGVVSDALKWVH